MAWNILLVSTFIACTFLVQVSTDCGGDPNALDGCGLNCNKQCSSYNKTPGICPRIQCPPHGCECKDGFFYDKSDKKCVLPENCDPSNFE